MSNKHNSKPSKPSTGKYQKNNNDAATAHPHLKELLPDIFRHSNIAVTMRYVGEQPLK